MLERAEVLLIDDEVLFSENLRAHFNKHGLPVSSITDPTVAGAINFHRFKVLLLDLDMPNVSGLDIVKSLPETGRPLVIIISGHSDIETRMKLLSQGADFFIPKPVNLDEVFLIVKQAIGRKHEPSSDNADWVLLRSSLSLLCADGTAFGLSSSEYRLLEMLFRAAPEAATKEELTEAATGRIGPSALTYFRSLEVMISRMRSRFSSESRPFPVKSLRNIGYLFHGEGRIED